MSNLPPGFLAASKAAAIGRGAFFSHPDEDLPVAESDEVAADDLLPQFGYVGSQYNKRRILLLGINPGNGPRRTRSSGDEAAMPALRDFIAKRTPESFVSAQKAYRSVCEGWAVWGRQCNELLAAGDIGMEEVAFTNALPWRTATGSGFSKGIARAAARLYVGPVVKELAPRIVIAVGKKSGEMLDYAGYLTESVVVWNRAQALRPQVIADRQAAAAKFAKLLNEQC